MVVETIAHGRPEIFLSASIPTAERAQRYFETADVIAIRDCIKALIGTALPRFTIVWGGHPSITPMVRLLAQAHPGEVAENFVLYQSQAFRYLAPKDNDYFRHVIWVEEMIDIPTSVALMRRRMIRNHRFVAAFFVGGMEGIETEFRELRDIHPNANLYPVATTGGAAKILFDQWKLSLSLSPLLASETAYPFLFSELLSSQK